jgi:hypothetical protein
MREWSLNWHCPVEVWQHIEKSAGRAIMTLAKADDFKLY